MDNLHAFLEGIASVESGAYSREDSYYAEGIVNEDGQRAYGRYQFLPSTYQELSEKAGLLNEDGSLDWRPETQDAVAAYWAEDLLSRYDMEHAARAWLGGEGNIDNEGLADANGKTIGDYGREVASYASAMLGEEYSPITAVGSMPVDRQGHSRYGHEYIPDAPAPMEERDPISRFVDAADDAILDSGVTSSLRYLWSWINPAVRGSVSIPGFSTPYTPSDEEIDYVKKLMPNDPTAQNFVLTNSYSQDHLFMLAAMKKQDYDRAVRLAQDEQMQGYNIAGIAGSLAGGMLEPVNLALMATGLSEGALIAKGIKSVAGGIGAKYLGGVTADTMVGQLARMFGTNADKLSMFAKSKVARMAANAATGASMMGLDRALSNKYGGFEANYAQYMVQAAILGNAFDAMRTVKGVLPKSKTLQKYMGT